MRRTRNTRLIATLGPASDAKEMIKKLALAGADVFRINASHGGHDEIRSRYRLIREVEDEIAHPLGILLDLQGPKLRIGQMTDGVFLQEGEEFTLDSQIDTPGDQRRAPLPHPEIFAALRPGANLLINDGKIRLEVIECDTETARTKIIFGGELTGKKGVNVPDVILPVSAMTPKDAKDLELALELGVDWIALSFVQTADDVAAVKKIVDGRAGVMAKIEKPSAVEHIHGIFDLADAVMVARGDLGVELPPEQVPAIQKQLIMLGKFCGKPVVVATQMLESMVHAPVPTRAEVSDVATAVYDGADAVMLSAESAAGKYPIEAVSYMDKITRTAENSAVYRKMIDAHRCPPEHTSSDAITSAARQVAETVGAAAIVTYTSSGSTALRGSRERPSVPIIALTPNLSVARRLSLAWGLNLVVTSEVHDFSGTVLQSSRVSQERGFAGKGDKLVITAGVPFGQSGTTNTLRIFTIGVDEI